MIEISKNIEQEIKNVIEFILHFQKYLSNKDIIEKKIKLSNSSKDVLNEISESSKLRKYLCHDEKIKKRRYSISLLNEIDSMLNKVKSERKINKPIRKVNYYNFNQNTILPNPLFYGNNAEFYFLKEIIVNKILDIVKSCFEYKFNNKYAQKKTKNTREKNKFILISSNSLKKAQLNNIYYKSLISNQNNNYNLSIKNFYSRKDSQSKDISNNKTNLNNTIDRKMLVRNRSCCDLVNSNMKKNSNYNNDKCTSVECKIDNKINNSKNNKRKKINTNIYLNKKKINEMEKSFLPLLFLNDFKYKNIYRFKSNKIPSFNSKIMELIHYNTKNNIKLKEEEYFLNECLKETNRSIIKISTSNSGKCFVDYSKSNIVKKTNDDKKIKKRREPIIKKSNTIYEFEYKNIFRYLYKGIKNKQKSMTNLIYKK